MIILQSSISSKMTPNEDLGFMSTPPADSFRSAARPLALFIIYQCSQADIDALSFTRSGSRDDNGGKNRKAK